jgi:hypothetical protein
MPKVPPYVHKVEASVFICLSSLDKFEAWGDQTRQSRLLIAATQLGDRINAVGQIVAIINEA